MSILKKTKIQIKALGILMFWFLFLGNTFAATSTVTVTFDQTPSQVSVKKAPLKYNKDFAYSFTYDDGYGEWYDVAYRYLNGWEIERNDNTIYPGLYYTDGAGNDVPFGGWFAITATSRLGVDLHDGVTPNYITWSQIDETYEAGWNILHHGYGLSPIVDYLQNILDNTTYIQTQTSNNILLQHFVVPDGETTFEQHVFSGWWMKSLARQATSFFFNGQTHTVTSNPVIVNNLDMNKYAMYRKYYNDSAYTLTTMLQDVDYMAANSTADNKLWRHAFTHRVTFDDTSLNWNLSWTKRKHMMDHIESNYGKHWTDKAWVAWPQDVYEYLATKDAVVVWTGLAWNILTIQLNNDNIDPDFVRKSLSLLVDAQWANITSIDYGNWDFEYSSHNTTDWLINLEWGLVYTGNLISKVESYVSEAESNRWQVKLDLAQTWVNFLDAWIEKTAFQSRLSNIELKWATRQINLWESSNTRGVWNNYNGYNTWSAIFTNIYDTDSHDTDVDISITQSFSNKYPWQAAAVDGDGLYANDVIDGGVWMYGNALNPGNWILKISWLNPARLYDIDLFGSTSSSQTTDRVRTLYTIWGATQELYIW